MQLIGVGPIGDAANNLSIMLLFGMDNTVIETKILPKQVRLHKSNSLKSEFPD